MTSLNLFLLFHLGFDAFAFDSGRQLREVVQVQRHAALVVREPAVDGMSEFRFFSKGIAASKTLMFRFHPFCFSGSLWIILCLCQSV